MKLEIINFIESIVNAPKSQTSALMCEPGMLCSAKFQGLTVTELKINGVRYPVIPQESQHSLRLVLVRIFEGREPNAPANVRMLPI